MKRELAGKANELTEDAMNFFEDVMCKIYRKSFDESEISDKLVEIFGSRLKLPVYQCNGMKNVVVYKKGTGKYKDASFPVILQAHMDMVCVSDSDKDIKDVFSEGITPYYADAAKTVMMGRSAKYPDIKTTLGADDGIGIAVIYAILSREDIVHPPIIAVFTVEEEDGMGGAAAITLNDIKSAVPAEILPKLDFSKAKLINIDDERDGVFCVSCAGGLRGTITLPVSRESDIPRDVNYYTLSVSGLKGGHSGISIHEGRANANILLCDVLRSLKNAKINPLFFSFGKDCGIASNVIPERASAVIAIPAGQKELFARILLSIECELKETFAGIDPGLKINAAPLLKVPDTAPYKDDILTSLLCLVCKLPDGVLAWDSDIKDLVQTSSNLGIIKDADESVVLTCMIRSSVDFIKDFVTNNIKTLCVKHGAKFSAGANSPGWVNKKDNRLRDLFLDKHKELFGKEAKALAIHAGLECGFFAKVELLGGIDMIACGPQLEEVHSVKEKLYTNTIPKLMGLLVTVLEDMDLSR